jgi:hypothetical protein
MISGVSLAGMGDSVNKTVYRYLIGTWNGTMSAAVQLMAKALGVILPGMLGGGAGRVSGAIFCSNPSKDQPATGTFPVVVRQCYGGPDARLVMCLPVHA